MKTRFLLIFLISLMVLFGEIQGAQAYAPSAPVLTAPYDGNSVDVCGNTTFWWRYVGATADKYKLYYKKGNNAWVFVEGAADNNYHSFAQNFFSTNATYQWSIEACNDDGCSAQSESWSFSTFASSIPCPATPPPATPPPATPPPTTPPPSSGGSSNCPAGQICNPLAYGNFEDLVNAIVKFIFNLGLVVAPIMFVISGIFFITSVGDPKRVKTAQDIALYTAIGFAVILLASGLIKVLQSLLGSS